MVDWLSEKRVVGDRVVPKSCSMSEQSQSASFAARVTAMYSLSVSDVTGSAQSPQAGQAFKDGFGSSRLGSSLRYLKL
jgi:hypothetical protein